MLRSITSNVFGDEFSGVPVTATKAEFKNMNDAWLDNDVSMDYYDPKKYDNLAGQTQAVDTQLSRQFYEVIGVNEFVPGYAGPQNE
jgi:hypothetical protein